jgi:hypothetical protein
MIGTVWERKGEAARDPGGFGRVAMTEGNPGARKVKLTISGAWTSEGKPYIWLDEVELRRDWSPLPTMDVTIPEVFPSCCLRCHRLNFGPCISATCSDLV